nr:MAG TPA: hypothetical protein [Caudoviricetes sp.]
MFFCHMLLSFSVENTFEEPIVFTCNYKSYGV